MLPERKPNTDKLLMGMSPVEDPRAQGGKNPLLFFGPPFISFLPVTKRMRGSHISAANWLDSGERQHQGNHILATLG